MALPEQIRKQSEAVQQLYTEMSESVEGDPNAPVLVEPVTADSVTAPVPPAAVIEPLLVGDQPVEDYEQKYRSLQGMYNAEVPKLHSTVKDQAARITQMESLMASLHTVPSPKLPVAQSLVTDTDKAEWGESIEMMRKVSREEAHPIYAKLATLETALNNLATSMNTSILPQVRQVAEQQAVTADDRFWSELQREVPNWMQTNNNIDFKSWLMETDALTGATRQSYLEQAHAQLDANRVAAFFRAYATASGSPITPAAQPNGSASELDKQIAPGRSRGGSPPVNPTAKTYSPADITKFYEDVRKGVYKGRESERNQLEADIFSARKENRIVATA